MVADRSSHAAAQNRSRRHPIGAAVNRSYSGRLCCRGARAKVAFVQKAAAYSCVPTRSSRTSWVYEDPEKVELRRW